MPAKPPRYHGVVVEWSDEKRCGFLAPRGGSPDETVVVFLPQEAIIGRRKPAVGDFVTYELKTVEDRPQTKKLRTKLRAQRVLFDGDEMPLPQTAWQEALLAGLGLAHLIAQALATLRIPQTLWLFLTGLGFSLLSIGLYAWDKSAAVGNRQRVSEAELNLFAFLGGWPGAAIAQRLFRHKTRKRSFQNAFRIAVALNILLTIAAYVYFSRAFGWAPGAKPIHLGPFSF